MSVFYSFMPSLEQFIGLLALVVTLVGFAVIGAACTGRWRMAAVDIFAGWGAVILVFVLLGVFTGINFSWLAYGFFAAAGLVAWSVILRDKRHSKLIANADTVWRILVLAIPFLLLVTAMRASQWDEFSHWLPNAQFLFQFDAFPRSDLPKSPSALPAYPYGLPLVTYLTSTLAGQFVENTSAIFNLLLLFFFAATLSQIISDTLEKEKAFSQRWGLLALCMLGVTILSTTFVQKIVLTSYADSTTSVTMAMIAVLLWKLLNRLADQSQAADIKAESRSYAWQAGLVIAAFLFLKQTNLVLLVLMLIGFLVVVIRDPAIRLMDFLKLCLPLLLPGIITYIAWRYHVGQHLSYGEVSLMPFENWLLGDAFTILARMSSIAAKKAPYFILMFTIAVFAVRSIMKTIGPTERLLIPIAVVFLGFNCFLWLMYVAVFGKGEGLRAASFWRYNIQLGLLGVTGATYGLALLWHRYVTPALETRPQLKKFLPGLPVVIVLVLPVVLQHKLRFDLRPQKDHMRMVGQTLAKTLPNGAVLAIVDLRSNGFTGKVMSYELTSVPPQNKKITVPISLHVNYGIKTPAQLNTVISKAPLTHIWVHQSSPIIDTALNVKLAPYASYLLKRNKKTWDVKYSWPYDGYTDPHSLPD
jgi:hypothetical protein